MCQGDSHSLSHTLELLVGDGPFLGWALKRRQKDAPNCFLLTKPQGSRDGAHLRPTPRYLKRVLDTQSSKGHLELIIEHRRRGIGSFGAVSGQDLFHEAPIGSQLS